MKCVNYFKRSFCMCSAYLHGESAWCIEVAGLKDLPVHKKMAFGHNVPLDAPMPGISNNEHTLVYQTNLPIELIQKMIKFFTEHDSDVNVTSTANSGSFLWTLLV